MESDEKKPRLKLSQELDQEKPPKRKSLWQKLLEVLEQELKRGREEKESRAPSDW